MKHRIITISLPKGGVGKSVTAINLGFALARLGQRVLLVDSDPQRGNMTLKLGLSPDDLKQTISNVIMAYLDEGDATRAESCTVNVAEGIDLLPANPKLSAIQNRLIAERASAGILEDEAVASEFVMKTILAPLKERYDTIIIDTSPSISMLAINALVAADSVLIPMEAHYESYEALTQLLDVVARIKAKLNPSLEIEGVLVTKYQSRTSLCRNIREMVEVEHGQAIRIFADAVPYSIKAAEQAVHGVSIFGHDPTNAVAQAYSQLAAKVSEGGDLCG